jgi:hypothetical protein
MDMILADRLSVLEQNLERAKDPSSWKEKLDLQHVKFEDKIWNLAIMDIKREFNRICSELAQLQSQLSAGCATGPAEWRRYTNIYLASQELFRDSLELIGGLALREKLLDQDICRLTDGLIFNCAESMMTTTSPTIAAHLELPPRILRRVVRMRYPEWTIWTIPLAAYEFGHIAVREIDELKKYCAKQAEEAVRPAQAGDEIDNDQLQRAVRSVETLMADAFATYTLGPAYACAALLLHFSPIADEPGTEFGPSGTQRATLVLGILKGMGKGRRPDDANAFAPVLKELHKRWDAIQQPVDATSQPIRLDPSDVLDMFRQELDDYRPQVRYPTDRLKEHIYGGWWVAQQWEEHWENELGYHTGRLTTPAMSSNGKLRDGLNAAWLCRLRTDPALLPDVEAAAQELCLAIVEERASPKRNSSRGRANFGPKG